MNLIVIPFHDWRKVQREGERTRDAHLIRELSRDDKVCSVLVVNRPISWPEMAYRRVWWKSKGTIVSSGSHGHLVQVAPKTYLLDTLDRSLISPLLKGKRHFFDSYGHPSLLSSVNWHRIVLGMQDCACLSFNPYAAALFDQIDCSVKHFDAWDNFLRFPSNQAIRAELETSYRTYANGATSWSTNSEENRTYYDVMLGRTDTVVIRNGVSPELFSSDYPVPTDMAHLPRPIVGMGLKVTHLLDTDLLNQVIWSNPKVTFVLTGQILDRTQFDKIRRVSNFHYLGDKHYRDYPAYVSNFDVCLVPYCTGDKQHGGDAIKFYEYLAAGKPVVATPGNGVSEDFPGVWVRSSPDNFSNAVREAITCGTVKRDIPPDLFWSHKAGQMLTALTRDKAREEAYVL